MGGSISLKKSWWLYLLISPMIICICVFKIFPIITSIYESLFADGSFTLGKYHLLFTDSTFWESFLITMKFNIILIPLQIVIAFAMALIVNVKMRGIGVFRTIFCLPFCISITITVVIWKMLLNINNGVVNSFLGFFGIEPIGFLLDVKWALGAIVLMCCWRGCAYWMMFFLAGLKGIDASIYESAQIDGAGFFVTLFRITIPLIKNTLLFVLVACTTANFLLFAPMQLATQGGPRGSTNVLLYEAYTSAFKYGNRSRSACITTILMIIVMLICFIQSKSMTETEG